MCSWTRICQEAVNTRPATGSMLVEPRRVMRRVSSEKLKSVEEYSSSVMSFLLCLSSNEPSISPMFQAENTRRSWFDSSARRKRWSMDPEPFYFTYLLKRALLSRYVFEASAPHSPDLGFGRGSALLWPGTCLGAD